jgi:hypothetical protein
MKEQNPEFQNLLRLLDSTEPANVQLGLQLAQNYQSEFEAYYGYSLRDYSELVKFLWRYEAWNFTKPINKIIDLNLDCKNLNALPECVCLLSRLKKLSIAHNKKNSLANAP